jgi:hypothetical protein
MCDTVLVLGDIIPVLCPLSVLCDAVLMLCDAALVLCDAVLV